MQVSVKGKFLRLLLTVTLVTGLWPQTIYADSSSDYGLPNPINTTEENPELRAVQKQTEEKIADLTEAGPRDLPAVPSDVFRLAGQKVVIERAGQIVETYALDDVNVNLPLVPFDPKSIRIEVDASKRNFAIVSDLSGKEVMGHFTEHFRKAVLGQGIARHIFNGIVPLAYTWDNELLIVIDQNRKIFAIDMGFASLGNAAFRSAIPVVQVGELPKTVKPNAQISATFLTRGLKPFAPVPTSKEAIMPQDLPESEIYKAGQLVVYEASPEGRSIVGIYDRGVIAQYVIAGLLMVMWQAYIVAPRDEAPDLFKIIETLLKDTRLHPKDTLMADQLDLPTSKALAAYSAEQVTALGVRIQALARSARDQKDRFTLEEWWKTFLELREEAAKSLEKTPDAELKNDYLADDLGRSNRELLESAKQNKMAEAQRDQMEREAGIVRRSVYRVMNSRAMRILAALAAGGALAKAASSLMADTGPAWGRHLGDWIYSKLPEVLKTPATDGYPAYRVTLLKHMIAMSLMVQFAKLMAVMSAPHLKWDFRKKGAVFAMRVSSLLQFPDLHVFAKAAMQPNFLASIKAGINPVGRIKADSPVGRRLGLTRDLRAPGLSNPFSSARHETNYLKHQALSAVAQDRLTATRNAGLLALRVASERYKTDLPTLLMVADAIQRKENELRQTGDTVKPEVIEQALRKTAEETVSHPDFYGLWCATALELLPILTNDPKALDPKFNELNNPDFQKYIVIAREAAERVEQAKKKNPLLTKLRTKFRMMLNQGLRSFVDFGYRESIQLASAIPGRFVYQQAWRSFMVDFHLTVMTESLFGTRANPNEPEKLVADPRWTHMYTSSLQMADKFNMWRSYLITNPAALHIMYARDQAGRENRYRPVEEITLTSTMRPESFVQGVWNWLKDVSNLSENDFGNLFIRSFKNKWRTWRTPFLFFLLFRTLHGQPTGEIVHQFLVFNVAAGMTYGWLSLLGELGNRGYMDRFDSRNRAFMASKVKFSQAIRLGTDQEIIEASQELAKLYNYEDSESADIKFLTTTIDEVLKMPPEQKKAELEKLLKRAQEKPPFPNAPNSKVLNAAIAVVSISTTVLATPLYTHGGDMALLPLILQAGLVYSFAYAFQNQLLPRMQQWTAPLKARREENRARAEAWHCSGLLLNLKGHSF
ncbi:MAG: hypothetical protein IT289_02635 [Oligoflexia bacterium]|nr:hypothetical protein [Oligoflexia bacterium]